LPDRGPVDRYSVRAELANVGVRPSKRFGQHFLVDEEVLAAIDRHVSARSVGTIVEIGPGLGAVTDVLRRRAQRVVAVEVDGRFVAGLRGRFADVPSVEIVHGDVLAFDFSEDRLAPPVDVVGSIPYRITTPILGRLVEQRGAVREALLITQREVAEKIANSPGPGGTAFGILVRAYADVRILRRIDRRSFEPTPDVDSTLWTMTFLSQPQFSASPDAFFALVRALYGSRRKMLRGVIRRIAPEDSVDSILERAELDGQRRGETLGFDELDRLSAALGDRGAADSRERGASARAGRRNLPVFSHPKMSMRT